MPAVRDSDLLIIGAGPAGCAAAITAARAGRNVVVIDRASFPRDKTCGDGLTTAGLRILESLGLPLTALTSSASVREVVVVSPTGRRIGLPLPSAGEYARVIARVDLDLALVQHTRSAGATIVEDCALAELKCGAADVEATAVDGTVFRAPFAIAADGNYSTVRRLLDPHAAPVLGEWSAFRQYFSGVDEHRLWVLFERDFLPGYAWVFPLPNGRANVGIAIPRGPGVTGKVLAKKWRDLLTHTSMRGILGPRATPEGTHRAWPIPSHLVPDRLVTNRVLFVGDAAGVVDPMTGEGIAQALETGVLAARATAGGRAPEVVASSYRAEVERTLGRDLRFGRRLQRVLAHPLGANGALGIVDLNGWTRRHFARWMFEDYPRALLLTPDRWHRRMLNPPAPYAP